MFSFVTEKSSLKIISHYSPQLLKYFGTSKKFLRTSGFLLATCPGPVAEKKNLITPEIPLPDPTLTLPSHCNFSSSEVGYLECLSFDYLCTGRSLWDLP